MKKILYVCALICAVMFTSCNGGDSQTPTGDKTNLWPAGKNGTQLYGYINKSGQMEIPAKYKKAYAFSCGWALVKDEDGEYFFIDKNAKSGKSVDKEEVCDYYFYYNLCAFFDGDEVGMWDNNFNVVIRPKEDLGNQSADGLIAFTEDSKDDEGWGYLNDKGDVKIPAQFYRAYSFVDGMAVVVVKEGSKDDPKLKYGVIDKSGNFIVEPQKNGLMSAGENRLGLIKYSTGKVVLVDKSMNELSGSYDDGAPFSCGLAQVGKSKDESIKYGYINAKGEEVIACKYKNAGTFQEDLAWVQKDADSKYELIDKNGETILKLKDDEYPYSNFRNGLALVCSVDKETYEYTYRYINKSNETIYKWTPGDDDDKAPMSFEEMNRLSVMQTAVAPLFKNHERAMKEMIAE